MWPRVRIEASLFGLAGEPKEKPGGIPWLKETPIVLFTHPHTIPKIPPKTSAKEAREKKIRPVSPGSCELPSIKPPNQALGFAPMQTCIPQQIGGIPTLNLWGEGGEGEGAQIRPK